MKCIVRLATLCVLTATTLAAEEPFAAPSPPLTAKAPAATTGDNEELARLYREDQEDRRPAPGQQIDWSVVIPRDVARERRVKELYTAGALHTGADYYYVAMVLQHGKTPEDFLLAHELCIVAIIKGENRAKWLAAASEDRFLMNIGRPQRFGTQYRSAGSGPTELYQTQEGVTDELRRELNVPRIDQAREREAALNKR